jgi:hypothetical protein
MCRLLDFHAYFVATFTSVVSFFTMLQIKGNEEYVDSGPPFLLLLHPALGPLWEVTRQKVSL